MLMLAAVAASAATASPLATPVATSAQHHKITARQARQIAMLVARHDNIDLSDTHIELNSMDLSAAFIPGYASFIVIRESTSPGPDETMRRYAVNRQTGDVWEMTLCTHYDFPALSRMRRTFAAPDRTAAAALAGQSRQLGCSEQKPSPKM